MSDINTTAGHQTAEAHTPDVNTTIAATGEQDAHYARVEQRFMDNCLVTTLEKEKTRAANTTKQYKPKQTEFIKWCETYETHGFKDGCLANEDKLMLFLREVVIPRGNRRKRNADGTPIPIGLNVPIAYASAMVDFYCDRRRLQNNPYPPPREEQVKALIGSLERVEYDRQRDLYLDRGTNTLLDGYTETQFRKVAEYFWHQNKPNHVRNLLDFTLGHHTLQQSSNKRE